MEIRAIEGVKSLLWMTDPDALNDSGQVKDKDSSQAFLEDVFLVYKSISFGWTIELTIKKQETDAQGQTPTSQCRGMIWKFGVQLVLSCPTEGCIWSQMDEFEW